jgi:endoglucanase
MFCRLCIAGFFSIVKTPKGMTYPSWNMWGNLQFATTSAMVLVQDARSNPNVTMRREEIAYARGQVDYALGSAGRSYIVGFGNAPPANIRHASSSCPNLPDICDDQNEFQKAPNFQKLNGAMVGGPAGTRRNPSTPDAYVDVRSDFATNEPAIEYAGGLVGALAGVFTYTSK